VVHVLLGIEVHHELVAEEIEVHPLVAAAAFRTAEQCAVKTARGRQLMDRNGKVKRLQHGAP
jgi:hypothetical protein